MAGEIKGVQPTFLSSFQWNCPNSGNLCSVFPTFFLSLSDTFFYHLLSNLLPSVSYFSVFHSFSIHSYLFVHPLHLYLSLFTPVYRR
jgi:hypothetical protein